MIQDDEITPQFLSRILGVPISSSLNIENLIPEPVRVPATVEAVKNLKRMTILEVKNEAVSLEMTPAGKCGICFEDLSEK